MLSFIFLHYKHQKLCVFKIPLLVSKSMTNPFNTQHFLKILNFPYVLLTIEALNKFIITKDEIS